MKFRLIAVLLCTVLLLSACASVKAPENPAEESSVSFDVTPKAGVPGKGSNVITFSANAVTSVGTGFTVDGTTVTVTSAGTYLLTGECADGRIIVDTQDEEKVVLKLNGLSLGCQSDAPVYVRSCPKKTVLSLCDGSVNLLWDTDAERTADAATGDIASACVFSKEDLTVKGGGTLYVKASYKKGIVSRDDLVVSGGTVYVSAPDDGIRGKDSVTVEGGSLWIESGADGISTSNEEDETKGNIMITGGTVEVVSVLDAVQAVTDVTVSGGTLVLKSGGGSASVKQTEKRGGDPFGGRGGPGGPGDFGGETKQTSDTPSTKGIKAGRAVVIAGGSVSVDSADDAVHANGTVTVGGGTLKLSSGDDGIHADECLTVSDGDTEVVKSFEGLEAYEIEISGGTVRVTSSDDGLNACGGEDGFGGPGSRGGRVSSEDAPVLRITGGYLCVDASGDGLDSNGSIYVTGGTVLVYGQTTGGNGAIDYGDYADSTCEISGGFLLTLDRYDRAQFSRATGVGQNVFVVSLGSGVKAGELLRVEDGEGNAVLTVRSKKNADMLVFSSPDLKTGETYTFYTGGTFTGTETDGICTGGTYAGGTRLGELVLDP